MATAEYNPIASSLCVTYKCPECDEITTSEYVGVPQPNYAAEKASDSENSADYVAICEHCEHETPLYLYTRYDGGLIDMPEVEEIIKVDEEFDEDEVIIPEDEE